MIVGASDNLFVLAGIAAIGLNIVFWAFVGILRLVATLGHRFNQARESRFSPSDVAIVIPAFNEENALPACLAAAKRVVSAERIFVGDDASTDQTRDVASKLGCSVHTAENNIGKARILDATISRFELCKNYKVILILDADSELDGDYLKYGLRLFDRPNVAVVAGHVVSRSVTEGGLVAGLINSYRSRLYAIVQAFVKYGQTWHCANVTYIAPGFASMYRTDTLKNVNIVAPGLVIEDFNMTFEIHRKQLGEVAYSPAVKCSTEDPSTLGDYSRQVRRWYLGFWQTIRRHRFWIGKFWLALVPVILESVMASLFMLALPGLVIWSFADAAFDNPLKELGNGNLTLSPELGIVAFLAMDFMLTCLAAAILRRPLMIIYGLAFPLIKSIDAFWFVVTLWQAFTVNSDGRWKSPTRANRSQQA